MNGTMKLSTFSKYTLLFVYFYEENKYFGWNLTPQSDSELITDLLFILLVAILFKKETLSTK